jgi:anti-repressor protein
MNDLISVTYDNDRPTISGRELHEKLGIGTQYTKWFERMAEYGFIDGSDYVAISQKRLTAQGNETTFTDHQLTIDMAKQICMIQRTDEGRRYREYFLEVERKWNSPEAIMGRALKIAENIAKDSLLRICKIEGECICKRLNIYGVEFYSRFFFTVCLHIS